MKAETEAAKMAIKEMFPASFQKASQAVGGDLQKLLQKLPQGTKRKAEAPEPLDAKNRLGHGVQIIKGSFLEKGDIIYEVVEDGDKFIATVTIATMGTSF